MKPFSDPGAPAPPSPLPHRSVSCPSGSPRWLLYSSGSMALAQLEGGNGAGAVTLLADVVKRLAQSRVRSAEVRYLALLNEACLTGDRVHARELDRRDKVALVVTQP